MRYHCINNFINNSTESQQVDMIIFSDCNVFLYKIILNFSTKTWYLIINENDLAYKPNFGAQIKFYRAKFKTRLLSLIIPLWLSSLCFLMILQFFQISFLAAINLSHIKYSFTEYWTIYPTVYLYQKLEVLFSLCRFIELDACSLNFYSFQIWS